MDEAWLKFYEPGVPVEIPYPEGMLVHHIFENTATRFPNRPVTVFPLRIGKGLYEGRVSYRDLDRAVNRFANGLATMGIRKGDRVALALSNAPQFLISFFGALKAGAIVVALDPQSPPEDLERKLIDSGAETVVTMHQFYRTIKEIQAKTLVTRVIATNIREYYPPAARSIFSLKREKMDAQSIELDRRDYSFKQILRGSSETSPSVQVGAEDIAILQYSGGIETAPKGAILTHRNLVSNCLQSSAWRTEAEPGREVALCVTPFFHSYGMQMAMLGDILLGGALILFPVFEPEIVLASIEKYRPSFFPAVPAVYIALLNYPAVRKYNLQSIRTYLSGVAPLPIEVQKGWEALSGARLVECFGSKESGPFALANPIHGKRKPGSIGIPTPGTQARIVDPESDGAELSPGHLGELALKGPQVFKGYWNRADETAKTLREGWLLTGDLAQVDEDGFFYVVNRKRETINFQGVKLFPRDIEEALYKNGKIKEAVVVGIDDPNLGQIPKAYIVLKEGVMASKEQVLDQLKQYLAEYKMPREVEFREALPKTMVGMVLKAQLQEEEQAKSRR